MLLGLLHRQEVHFSRRGAKPWDLAADNPRIRPALQPT